MTKFRRYKYSLFIFSLFVGLLFFFSTQVKGQEAIDLLTVSQSVVPDSLLVGEQAVVTLELHGGSLDWCLAGRSPADIVLVIDTSASMHEQQKMLSAVQAASRFIADADLSIDQIAIVAFSNNGITLQPLTQKEALLQESLDQLNVADGTNILAGLQEAQEVLLGNRVGAERYIVLLSDGKDDHQESLLADADALRNQSVRVFTISLGGDVDRDLMQQIASMPTDHYNAPTAADLQAIYDAIGGQIAESVATDIFITTTFTTVHF